jgi:hypothetical protein
MSETPVLPIIDLSEEDFPFTQPDPIPEIPSCEKPSRKRMLESSDFPLAKEPRNSPTTLPGWESNSPMDHDEILKKIKGLFLRIEDLHADFFDTAGSTDKFDECIAPFAYLFE